MDSVEIGADVSEILETQDDLSHRISRVEESVFVGQDNESLCGINRLEVSVSRGRANKSLREYQAKVDECVASVERLTDRLRTQHWYHELSEQESDDEIGRMVEDQPRPPPPRHGAQRTRILMSEVDRLVTQIRGEFHICGLDRDALTQLMQRFLEEHQRREESGRANLEQRVAQFRHMSSLRQ